MYRKAFLIVIAFTAIFSSLALADPKDIVWTDDVSINPVIKNPPFGSNRAYFASVVFDKEANIWRAWYDASSSADLSYAESTDPDGKNWTNYKQCTGFTSGVQSKAFVLKVSATQFRMWYMAENRVSGYIVSTCVSTDGVNWTDDQWITGIADPDMQQFGPVERMAVVRLADGSFVSYVRCEETEITPLPDTAQPGRKLLYRYTSKDGIKWTWAGYTGVNDLEGLDGLEFSSVVKHPDRPNVWYAWGNNQNATSPIYSFVSSDDGKTFQLDESPVAVVGDINTESYNVDRNYHASVTYLGNGKWVMFRSVAEPKTTARAAGVEKLSTPVEDWQIH